MLNTLPFPAMSYIIIRIHTHKKESIPNSYGNKEMNKILCVLFELVKSLGGTISGEHGIGLIQKDFLHIVFDETNLNLMRSIKKVFDPNNILNPGKIFDL